MELVFGEKNRMIKAFSIKLISTKYKKKSKTTMAIIISWEHLMFDQIFLSPQVKQSVIINNKHGISELLHKLPNDLKLMILGN